MFNGILKSDDVEVYETTQNVGNNFISLSDNCKSNIIIAGVNAPHYVNLPQVAYIGKVINITSLFQQSPNGKTAGTASASIYIQHSNTTLYTLKQGTVSFMYVGQQLNGLTATDKSKSGWIILGGVQGDTAITGYAGSVAIGSGAYCSNTGGIAIGQGTSVTNFNGVGIGLNVSSTGNSAVSIGNGAISSGLEAISIGSGSSATAQRGFALGYKALSATNKGAFKANNMFSVADDAQAGKFILMRQTTDATPLVISATNAAASTTNILILPNNGTYAFKGIVVAKDASTLDSAMWEVTALMKRGANASTTALVGTPTVTKVFNDTGAATWSIALTADTTNGGGAITVTGEAGKTIRWVCNVDSAELI